MQRFVAYFAELGVSTDSMQSADGAGAAPASFYNISESVSYVYDKWFNLIYAQKLARWILSRRGKFSTNGLTGVFYLKRLRQHMTS